MKRNSYSTEFKLQVVKEALETGNKALVARRYELANHLIYRWMKDYEEGKYGKNRVEDLPDMDTKELSQENDQLKKLLGEKDLEIAILRDLIKKKNPHLLKKLK